MTTQNIIAYSQRTIKNYYLIKKTTKLKSRRQLNINELLTIFEEKEKKYNCIV